MSEPVRVRKHKAIFFDRDGTLIEDKHYLNDPAQVVFAQDVIQSLKQLRYHSFLFFVITNQSGLSRGLVSIDAMNAIHNVMDQYFYKNGLEIKKYYYSYHLPTENHVNRKPQPGMLLQAAKDFSIDLPRSWMIGDKVSDALAGYHAGCQNILLGSTDPNPEINLKTIHTQRAPSLQKATEIIIS